MNLGGQKHSVHNSFLKPSAIGFPDMSVPPYKQGGSSTPEQLCEGHRYEQAVDYLEEAMGWL